MFNWLKLHVLQDSCNVSDNKTTFPSFSQTKQTNGRWSHCSIVDRRILSGNSHNFHTLIFFSLSHTHNLSLSHSFFLIQYIITSTQVSQLINNFFQLLTVDCDCRYLLQDQCVQISSLSTQHVPRKTQLQSKITPNRFVTLLLYSMFVM
jgi:hypothetical protein